VQHPRCLLGIRQPGEHPDRRAHEDAPDGPGGLGAVLARGLLRDALDARPAHRLVNREGVLGCRVVAQAPGELDRAFHGERGALA
jgi:hypothetical protein